MKSTIETLRDAYAFAVEHDACEIADEMLVAVDELVDGNPDVWKSCLQHAAFYLQTCLYQTSFRTTLLALEWMQVHLPCGEYHTIFNKQNTANHDLVKAFLEVVDEWASESSVADSSGGEAEA